jgi:predicted RNA-binding Zn ribbon-like protein
VTDALAKTEHELTVTGLAANTTYYYSVGTDTTVLAGGDSNHFFVTPPPAGGQRSTRIWVLGDAGTKDANQARVRDAYHTFTGTRHTDLWLMLGDNAYDNGTDTEYQAAVFDMYPAMLRKSVLWPTIGNHDTASSTNPPASLPYFQMFTLPVAAEAGGVASGTEKYYSFDFGNIHFVCLDSMSSSRQPGSAMLTWLQNDLAANSKDWLIAFFHHPPYTKGSHNSDTETELIEIRQNVLPILENYGVDLVLTGHSHSYERSFLIDGHYGLSTTFTNSMKINGGSGRPAETGAYTKPLLGPASHMGAVYAVAGSSGKISGGTLNHPAMFISLNALGSMVLDVNGGQLDAKFLTDTGTVADSFTMIKGAVANTPPTVSMTSPANGAAFTAPATVSLAANAADADGTVVRVDFYQGTTLLFSDTTAPYAYSWTNVAAGTYSLTARAVDNLGAVTASSAVSITVTAPQAVTFIAKGATWRYLDNGSNQGTAWRGVGFNDAAWKVGAAELGYGDGGEATVVSYGPSSNNKYVTTYFRTTFNVADLNAFNTVQLNLLRDDGAVVYVNGVEAVRSNMPSGTIGYLTLASSAVNGGNETTYFPFTVPKTALVAGTNTIAVEVHQNARNSSDLSFNLELRGLP